jgi:hypothetical protein
MTIRSKNNKKNKKAGSSSSSSSSSSSTSNNNNQNIQFSGHAIGRCCIVIMYVYMQYNLILPSSSWSSLLATAPTSSSTNTNTNISSSSENDTTLATLLLQVNGKLITMKKSLEKEGETNQLNRDDTTIRETSEPMIVKFGKIQKKEQKFDSESNIDHLNRPGNNAKTNNNHVDNLIRDNDRHTLTFKKSLETRLYPKSNVSYSGLTPVQGMELEKSALLRIAELCGFTNPHFPKLVTSDNQSMTTTSVGLNFDSIKRKQVPLQLDRALQQIGNIIDCLRVTKIRHLDVFPFLGFGGCKNFAISLQDQTLALFDFDISVIDNKPLSSRIEKRMERTGSTFQVYEDTLRSNLLYCLGFCKTSDSCKQIRKNETASK